MARPCTLCTLQPGTLAAIEHAISEAQPIAAVARRFAVSEDALGRHVRHHLAPAIRRNAEVSRAVDLGGLARRVASVADDARTARQAAHAAGRTGEALRAGDAELRVLSTLADRLGIDDDATSIAIEESVAFGEAVAYAVSQHPDIAAPIVAALNQAGATAMADQLSSLAVKSRTNLASLTA